MEYKLYVKVRSKLRRLPLLSYVRCPPPQASPDGRSLGDCPFTQKANIAMKLKGVLATYVLIDSPNKPKWYYDVNPSGTVPALEFGDRVIGDSADIVVYLDEAHPSPSLQPPGNDEAETETGNIFNVFSAWAKNSKDPGAAEKEAKFTAELKRIDQFLTKFPGPLLCGTVWSRADCALVPRLYHMTTVARHFLNYDKFQEMEELKRYIDYTFASEPVKATDYKPEWILTGWGKYFQ